MRPYIDLMILPERNIGSAALRSDGRPRHRGLIIFIATLILVFTGYATWWYLLVDETRQQLDAWFADVRTAGHDITVQDIKFSGFPSRITIGLENLKFTHANGQWHVDVPYAQAYGTPWELNRIDGSVGIPVSIEHRHRDRTDTYNVASADNAFVVTLSDQAAFDLTITDAAIEGSNIEQLIKIDALAARLAQGDESIFLRASLNANGITLPDPQLSPFGEKIASLQTDIDILVRPTHAGSLAEQLDIWRRSGGAVEVRRLSVRHGVLGLDGDGTITLDQNLQPEGAFGVSVIGFNPAVDALVAKEFVKRQEGQLAKAALGLFAKVPAGGGPKQIDVPLTIQDRKLTVGPFPLIRVPRIYWE